MSLENEPAMDAVQDIPVIDAEPLVEQPATRALPETVEDLMTEDEFALFMSHSFTLAGGIIGTMSPPPLRSLMEAGELPTARPAFNALYGMARDFPWLRFLISKDGMWIANMAAIGAFGMQLGSNIAEEMRARNARRVERPQEQTDEVRMAA